MAAIHFKWFVKGHSALVHDNGHFQNQYKTIWISTLDMLKSKFPTKSTIQIEQCSFEFPPWKIVHFI